MPRLAVMAHFDHDGAVAPHVRRQVLALASSFDDLVVVTTSSLTTNARTWLDQHARVVERANYGYDFFSYKVGLDVAGDLTSYDEIVVCNDSYVGPLVGYDEMAATMAHRPVDFWGLTTNESMYPHLQSFFVAFRPWVIASEAFTRFWSDMAPLSERQKVINRYEVGMTRQLTEAGFASGTYFTETESERHLAARRHRWGLAHRNRTPTAGDVTEILRGTGRPRAWNPSAALADRALNGRMPFVKIDTLRYDPYILNAARLLGLCEATYPDLFDGVRAHLAATDSRYPRRPGELAHPTPLALRPLRPLVEYRRVS